MKRAAPVALTAWTMMVFGSFVLGAQELTAARIAASQGKVDTAISAVKTSTNNPESQELLCQLYGSVENFDSAIHACEAAHMLRPKDSMYTLELARAYGAKASHAGTFTGMRMVGRIRENFEAAVQQDPRNVDALSDLGEFYVNAPAMVGGGLDKARSLVPNLQRLSPARAARLGGMIATKAGDDSAAESAYARELAVAHSPEAYVDLANYARTRKQWDRAEQNAVLAMQHDINHGPDTLDAAQILIEMKRNGAAAEKGLRSYLGREQVSGVASFARAHVLLGSLLEQRGDAAGAHDQYAAALSLAHDYGAAKRALHS